MNHDLKHTYTIRPTHYDYKNTTDQQGLLKLQRMREAQQIKTAVIAREPFCKEALINTSDLLKLPPGPSYRYYSREEIDELVERLCRPTVASQGFERQSEIRSMTARRESSPRFTGLKPASTPREEVLRRLRQQTHMTTMRAERNLEKIMRSINANIQSDSKYSARNLDSPKQ